MEPLSTIKTVFDFFADEATSDGTDLTKDKVKDILKTRKLIELLNQFDERFEAEHLAEISEKKINIQSIFNHKKELIRFAEESIATAYIDININRKDQFLKRSCEIVGNSNIVSTYLSGFYDIVFMKETKCASDEEKALFNNLSDQICMVIKRIDQEVKELKEEVGDSKNGQLGSIDFSSFYDAVLKDFTEENDDNSAALVGNLSAEKSYIDAFIKVRYEYRHALSYLNDWFNEKKYGTLLIHGEPGHGKSMLCKKAVFEYVSGRFLNGKAKNILTVSLNTGWNPSIISAEGVDFNKILVWGAAKEHRFSFEDCREALLFMDGFDEFVDDAAKAGVQEQDIAVFLDRIGRIAKFYDLHIIVLSRTIAIERYLYESAINDKCFSLAPITEEQQVKWLEEHGVEGEYREKYKRLQADLNMRDLLGIPLLFRMIVHTRFDKISSNVVGLYNTLFDHLMEKRNIRGKALEEVRRGLNELAYEVYCYDTDLCEFKDEEWNVNWILAFYVKTAKGKKIGFFHRSFYQYFLAKYIYDGLLHVREDNAEKFLGSLAERELDNTVKKYLSLLISNSAKVHDNIELVIDALVRTEAYLNYIPKYPLGNAEKTRIGRSANITRNMIHIAESLSYVIQKPYGKDLATLIKTFGGHDLYLLSTDENLADLSKVDLSNANLDNVRLYRANLREADLSGANLSGANLCEVDLRGAKLNGAKLINANLSGAKLNGANLNGADLNGANLSQVDLRKASLCRADLTRADLKEACLSGTDLSGAYLIEADLCGAVLNLANLKETYLVKASMIRVKLKGAKLYRADLSRTYLIEADLCGADLIGADLNGADLNGADLRADLRGANLNVKCLTNTKIEKEYKNIIDQHIEGYKTIQWGANVFPEYDNNN